MAQAQKAPVENTKPDFILETFIKTSKEKLWHALTHGSETKVYHFAGAEVRSMLEVGGRFDHYLPDGSVMLGGTIVAIDPPNRLEMTFEPGWMGPGAEPSSCAYEIEEMGEVCKLRIVHFAVPKGQEGVAEGWARIASSLKSYLETGKPLSIPGM